MKLLNTFAAIGLAIAFAVMLRQETAPPEDPWFQNAVTTVQRPVLVKFGADWCPPCRHQDKVLEQARPHISSKVKIVRIDIDDKPEIAQHYGISAIPRFYLFFNGKVIAKESGFRDARELESWVTRETRSRTPIE